MDMSNVPKSFWHSLSFCIVVATLGLLFIAYKSSSVSIEIADAKINLSSALVTAKEIKSDLEAENERLKKANEQFQMRISEISGELAKVGRDSTADLKELLKEKPLGEENTVVRKQVVDPELFKSLEAQIQQVQGTVKVK